MKGPVLASAGLALGISGGALAQPTTIGQPTKAHPGKIELTRPGEPLSARTYRPSYHGGRRAGRTEQVRGVRAEEMRGERPDGMVMVVQPAPMSVEMDFGRVQYVSWPEIDPASSLAAADQRALNDLYAREMLHSAALLTHVEQQRQEDPETAGLLGRLMTDHLILASRARQLYRTSGTTLPYVSTEVRVTAASPETSAATALELNRRHLEYLEEASSRAADPRVQEIFAAAGGTAREHAALIPERREYIAAARLFEQVAGVREEQYDGSVLAAFYALQSQEAGALRAAAEHLQSTGYPAQAAEFQRLAEERRALATAAEGLLRSRSLPVPQLAEQPGVTGSPEVLGRYALQRRQMERLNLVRLLGETRDPAIRQLIAEAIQRGQLQEERLQPGRPGQP